MQVFEDRILYPCLRSALVLGSLLLVGCNAVPTVPENAAANTTSTKSSQTLASAPEPVPKVVIEEQSMVVDPALEVVVVVANTKPNTDLANAPEASPSVVPNTTNASAVASAVTSASSVAVPRQHMSPTDPIELWLVQANLAIEKDQLTTPVENNAYAFYARVLMQDGDNAQAFQGLERIVQRYLILAKSAHEKGKFKKSQLFLSRANKVVPGHAQIAALKKQLAQSKTQAVAKVKKQAKKTQQLTRYKPLQTQQQSLLDAPEGMQRQRILLPAGALKNEASALAIYLRSLARQIEQVDGRLYIIAPRDKEVRWVYALLNGTNPDYRIRANIKHKSPAAIEVMYKADSPLLDVFH